MDTTTPVPPTPPPTPPPNQGNDKLLAVLCHVSPFLGFPFILPLIIFFVKREESPLAAAHAKEALNFHISLAIYSLCCLPPSFFCCFVLCIPILIALGLFSLVCSIVAAIKASEGGFFRYPLTIRFIS